MRAVDCVVREAKLADAPAMAGLMTQLGYPTTPADMERRLDVLLAQDNYRTLVAEVVGQVVGLVGAYVQFAVEFDGRYARLTGLVVDEAWRGWGIGRRLMQAIEAWVRGEGAVMLALTSGKQRLEAHQFYRSLGYEETGLRFVKRFG